MRILQHGFGIDVRARVYARREYHREPTLEEIEELVSDARSREIASSLSWQEISAAYERNEEEIGVWCMKCVGYDVEFQRLLVDNADRFTPPAGKRKRTA